MAKKIVVGNLAQIFAPVLSAIVFLFCEMNRNFMSFLMVFDDSDGSSSDSEDEIKKGGGSVKGKRPNIERNRVERHLHLMQDYFLPCSTFDDTMFRRRFRLPKSLFLQIKDKLIEKNRYWAYK